MSTERFLLKHAAACPVSFHMPGHKGSEFYKKHGHEQFLRAFMDCDITEIPGADNLFHGDGILEETAKNYANLYNVDRTFLLVNGTSCGIISSILATVPIGGKLIMARNSHKSVYNALKLGNITPVYIYPEIEEQFGISAGFTPETVKEAIAQNPDASAVILPSPNYYGICSDIKSIADVCHSHNKVLIVDQAHGAHLKMMESGRVFNKEENDNWEFASLPIAAETAGADLVINSTHKTMASFTQSAILNKQGDRVDELVLEDKLQMIESSSPSYLLMASLDINQSIVQKEGQTLADNWMGNLRYFYNEIKKIPRIKTIGQNMIFDFTKINIDTSDLGISGADLEKELIKRNIFIELTTGNLLMCMTGIGTRREHLEKLLRALKEIEGQLPPCNKKNLYNKRESIWNKRRQLHKISNVYSSEDIISVPISKGAGYISAGQIIPYPPGIPLICEGEAIDEEDIAYLEGLTDNIDILGVNKGLVRVYKKL